MTREQIQRAAMAFARDYGPLSAALRGDEEARDQVAVRLMLCLSQAGLALINKEG